MPSPLPSSPSRPLLQSFPWTAGRPFATELRRLMVALEARIAAVEAEQASTGRTAEEILADTIAAINEQLVPITDDLREVAELGFMLAESDTLLTLQLNQAQEMEFNEQSSADLFVATPYVFITRKGDAGDWALANVLDYQDGALTFRPIQINGNPGPHSDWQVTASAVQPLAVETWMSAALDARNMALEQAGIAENASEDTLANLRDFFSRYLGGQPANPTTDLNGDPLAVGMLYFNTVLTELRVYTGTEWIAYSPGNLNPSIFTDLVDTPDNYVGSALKFVRVKAGADGLEFATPVKADVGLGNVDNVTQLRKPSVVTITSGTSYAMQATDDHILINKAVGAPHEVLLVAASSRNGHPVKIVDARRDAGVNAITLRPNGTESILGLASFLINTPGGSVLLWPLPDGSGWYI